VFGENGHCSERCGPRLAGESFHPKVASKVTFESTVSREVVLKFLWKLAPWSVFAMPCCVGKSVYIQSECAVLRVGVLPLSGC